MMEVTPHLKSVLKNYQHSATKSLHGPGLAPLVPPKSEPQETKEDEYIPPSIPVQQLPILTTPDTSCSERTETILEGETISCFVVGGERRLCLPQVLNSVLRDFTLPQINHECDQLQIYCSRCTPEQLNVLKNQGILPSSAASSGLITKTDAERLCSALLYGQNVAPLRPFRKTVSFSIYHKCFGKCRGICYPELYTGKNAKCIECVDCQGGFSPQQFVCHVHKHFSESRTVHWGFDSTNWRQYLKISKEQGERDQFCKYLNEMKDQYEGKLAFPLPQNYHIGLKRKQILATELMKDHDLPLKKQKLVGEYLNSLPFNFPHVYAASIDSTLYLQNYIQEYQQVRNRHLSAFKAVNHHTINNNNNNINNNKDTKMHHYHTSHHFNSHRYATEPPLLQNPERVVLMSESERFERTYQPNVALAPPPTPKKHHRYGKYVNNSDAKNSLQEPVKKDEVKLEVPDTEITPKLVSVVQSIPETPVKSDGPEPSEIVAPTNTKIEEDDDENVNKINEILKDVELTVRDRIVILFRNLTKENRLKDERILELENRIREKDIKKEEKTECNGNDDEKDSSSIIKNCDQTSVIANLEQEASAAPE